MPRALFNGDLLRGCCQGFVKGRKERRNLELELRFEGNRNVYEWFRTHLWNVWRIIKLI